MVIFSADEWNVIVIETSMAAENVASRAVRKPSASIDATVPLNWNVVET